MISKKENKKNENIKRFEIDTTEILKLSKTLQADQEKNNKKNKKSIIELDNGTLILDKENLNLVIGDFIESINDILNIMIGLYNSNIDTLKDLGYIEKNKNGNYIFTD